MAGTNRRCFESESMPEDHGATLTFITDAPTENPTLDRDQCYIHGVPEQADRERSNKHVRNSEKRARVIYTQRAAPRNSNTQCFPPHYHFLFNAHTRTVHIRFRRTHTSFVCRKYWEHIREKPLRCFVKSPDHLHKQADYHRLRGHWWRSG